MTRSIHTAQMIALRAWLYDARTAQNLPMRTLAERLDRPHSFVQRVENGDRRLDVVEFIQYCQALGIDPKVGFDLVLRTE
ncbi:helix-turn-helix domain-containing protein [Moraxella bovis]|uniref:Helix-turn-helix domain-containing protein n=1 Tax=Moraxella bovis TaxID=476 RepID=A0AAQ2Q7T5_MORBO|nr:helix-turn-helix transcriptional regulator [Moraxella bovis]AWY21744.1 XRE family transcriptional regulator [Moraxella bovis]OOR90032.1 transcriptional regulator [Moraxella bovis]UYZ68913.1 helix-turn-helix domain-containing protein [Moraxella bovis]UYZ71287.1 helix-turn-helix domain-containing protein [Moraxella bovis]UYZ72799.1 helix-turn-helix domain-containing protein [Moraxella bovis]